MSHLMTSITDNDGAANPIPDGDGSTVPEGGSTVSPAEASGGAEVEIVEEDTNAQGGEEDVVVDDEVIEEEVIEEEYYEEEEYEEEEIIEEEVVDDDDEDGVNTQDSSVIAEDTDDDGVNTQDSSMMAEDGAVNSQDSSMMVEDETQESSQMAESSSAGPPSSAAGTADGSAQPASDGFADFADFPPLSDNETAGSSTTGSPPGDGTSTSQPAGTPIDVDDVENQQQTAQFTPRIPPARSTTNNREVPEADKEPIKPSPFWYWLVFALICGLLGGGAYLGWFLVNEDRKDAPDLGEDDDITRAPTPAPTIGQTTAFDPIQGDCDFRGLQNPHVIDQCNCVGEIQIIADDVRARYESLRENFISTLYQDYDEEIDSCAPQNQALVWISSGNGYEFSYEEKVDRFALATLYAGLNGNDWDANRIWLTEASACNWARVTCDEDGMVQSLALSNNNLEGTLPPEVGLLASLVEFSAAGNGLEGAIPEALFYTESLALVDLGFNAFTGPVPPAVGRAKNLKVLSLDWNKLSGLLSRDLAGAENLEVLNLSNNELVGSLPATLFDLSSLTALNLGANELMGTIPSTIANFQELTSLTLGPNSFSGEIPSAIAELTKLEILVIREVPELTGRLPAVVGRNLKQLLELTISQTSIAGNIETYLGDLPNLIRLDLSENQLRGTIPLELGNLGNLTTLDLGNNFLEGAIPVSLGNLANLTRMSLNDNVFRGGVPNEFAMLENIEFMRLDGTLLTGRVAQEVCDLRDLDLSNFIVDCPSVGGDGVQVGVICDIPSCCTGCRSDFS